MLIKMLRTLPEAVAIIQIIGVSPWDFRIGPLSPHLFVEHEAVQVDQVPLSSSVVIPKQGTRVPKDKTALARILQAAGCRAGSGWLGSDSQSGGPIIHPPFISSRYEVVL